MTSLWPRFRVASAFCDWGLLMIDWNRALEIGINGAPAAAYTVCVVWAIWFIRRLFRSLARHLTRTPEATEAQAPIPRRGVRIEPVLERIRSRTEPDREETSLESLRESVAALVVRVELLEQQIASLKADRDQPKR